MRRPLSAALVLLSFLLLVLVPAGADARDRELAKPLSKKDRAAMRAEGGREIAALRTANSKTFAQRGGQRTVRVSAGRLHFRNARGRWQDVDTTLRRSHGRLLNRTTGFSTSLPLDLGRDSVRVRRGKWSVGFALRGATGAAQVRGSRVVYRGARPGVDVDYQLLSDSLKETLTLRSPAATRRFVFDLEIGKKLRPRLVKSKGLLLVDQRGTRRLAFAAPFMVDGAGKRAAAGLRLANVGGRWRLTVTATSSWLEQQGRAWPVKLDPAVYPSGDADCYLDAGTPDSSFCADTELWVGHSSNHDHRAVLRFDGVQNAVPRGADIIGSTLRIHQLNADNAAWVGMNARALNEPFTGASTWNRRDGATRWSEAGGEADQSETGKVEWGDALGGGLDGDRFLAAIQVVRDWTSGKRANHGVVISADHPANGARFAATEHVDPAKRPELTIRYTLRTGERRGYVHERQQLSDRISLGVNVASGNLNVRQTDLSVPGGLGPDIGVSRSYDSLQDEHGALGRWSLDTTADLRVGQIAAGRYVRIFMPGGAEVPFTRKLDGTYVTPPGYDMKLERNDTTAVYTLTENASQTKYRFPNNAPHNGRISEMEDRNGRKLTYVYGSGGTLARVESAHTVQGSAGDEPRFTWTSGRVTQMTDPAGRQYGYGYTGSDLTSYTDPENGTGNKTLYEYGGVNGQLSKITTPQGRITTVEYYPLGHEHAGKVKAFTRVTNTANLTGPRWELSYVQRRDGSGETRVTDPIGVTTPDTDDRVTTYTFDGDGRVTKTKDALGRETQRKITSTSKVESYTAAGNTGTTPNTKFSYDKDTDNLTQTETPTGEGSQDMTTSGSYGATGQINNGTSGSAYLPTEGINEQGNVTKTNYQVPGQTNGNVSGVSSFKRTDGSPDTLVSGVAFEYETGAAGTAGVVDGKPGQLKVVRDGRTNPTSYEYDPKGNVKRIVPPAPLGDTNLVYHAGLGRVERVQDGKDNWRYMSYDALDRLTRIEYRGVDAILQANEPFVAYTYDRDGNQLTEESREEGTGTMRTRTMTYDTQNRVTYEALPGGASNTYTYDLIGNLTSLTDATGKTEYTYDASNQQRSVFEPGTIRPTKFDYSVDGLKTKTAYPNGVTVDWGYDPAFRMTSIVAKNGGGTVLQQLAYKYQDPSTQRQTPIRYEKHDAVRDQRTRYGYDGLGRLLNATIKTGAGTETDAGWAGVTAVLAAYDYALDAAGNVTTRTVSGTAAPASVTNYAYNAANQLCWRSPTSGAALPASPCAAGTQQTAFDANGNELTGPAGSGRTATYNLLDQTTQFSIGGSPTALLYLGTGQDRWTTEGSATFQHNVLGLGTRTAAGATTATTRDEKGALVSRRAGTARHYYLTDALGSVTGLTDSAGAVAERYEYDPYGEAAPAVADQWGAGTANVATGQYGFAGGYRSVGGMYHFGQRYYDPSAMRWTQADPLDQTGSITDSNKYLYASADPVGMSDLSGLVSVDVDWWPPVTANVQFNRDETWRIAKGGRGAAIALLGTVSLPGALLGGFAEAGWGDYADRAIEQSGVCLGLKLNPRRPPRLFLRKC